MYDDDCMTKTLFSSTKFIKKKKRINNFKWNLQQKKENNRGYHIFDSF